MAKLSYSARDFLKIFVSAFTFPGASFIQKAIPYVIASLPIILGISLADDGEVVFPRRYLKYTLTAGILLLWVFGAIGYAWARFHRAKLIVSDHLSYDGRGHIMLAFISCRGFGDVKPVVTIEGLFEGHGHRIFNGELEHQKLEPEVGRRWSDITIREGMAPLRVQVFGPPHDGMGFGIRLEGGGFRNLLLEYLPHDMNVLCIRLRIYAENCEPVTRCYVAVNNRPSSPYRAGYPTEPIPTFCQPTPPTA